MRKIVATLLLVSVPVFAQDAQQICLEPQEAYYIARHIKSVEAENESLKKSIQETPNPVVAIVLFSVAALALGAAAGYGVATVVKKP